MGSEHKPDFPSPTSDKRPPLKDPDEPSSVADGRRESGEKENKGMLEEAAPVAGNSPQSKTTWIKDLILEKVPNAHVMTFSYNSTIAAITSMAAIDDIAWALLHALIDLLDIRPWVRLETICVNCVRETNSQLCRQFLGNGVQCSHNLCRT